MITIITNNVPRNTIDAWELDEYERSAFDYLDWDKINSGEDSATFVRYKGEVIDLGEFSTTLLDWVERFPGWHGYRSDSFFSGILIRYSEGHETVVMGRYYC